MPHLSAPVPRLSASRIVGAYGLASVVWIALSDQVVAAISPSVELARTASTLKGWGFVALTAALLAILLRRYDAQRARQAAEITAQRVLSEQTIRSSEERYRRIAASVTDYLYAVRVQDGRAVSTKHGPGCEGVTGYPPLAFGADPDLWLRIILPEDREAALEQERLVLAGGTPAPLELRILPREGAVRWVRVAVVPHRDARGELVAYDGLVRDITERRALQEQLRQVQKMEAIGQLAGGIAHDFNNLLTAMRGYTELARASLGPDSHAADDLDHVTDAVDRAADLTRQLLAFSRRQVLRPQVMDPGAAATRLVPMMRRLLGEHIELEVAGIRSEGHVRVDPTQLDQVLLNLSVNAGQAMASGGRLAIETADVELEERRPAIDAEVPPGSYVVLTVSDNGSGMDAETKARAFEPFFTTKDPGQGTGLGLATVYGIVKQSQGFIHLDTEPGVGTIFRIYLPRVDEPVTPVADPPQPGPARPGGDTVLLVEDDLVVRGFARRALEAQGFTVVEAAAGDEALAIAADPAATIDALVTDLIMPGMDGRELATRVMALRPGVRIVFMSGFPERRLADGDLSRLDAAFLAKPFDSDALARTVRQALGRAGSTGPAG